MTEERGGRTQADRGDGVRPGSGVALPRVRIVLITRGYPHVETALTAAALGRRHDADIQASHGEPASVNREIFANRFLESDGTHLLLIDEFVLPPITALDDLLAHDQPIVSGVYPQWASGRVVSSACGLTDADWPVSAPATVFPVRRTRLGCVLIRRDVFDRVPRPWFMAGEHEDGTALDDDEWFCDAVRRAGLRILCDGRVLCGQMVSGVNLLAAAGEGFRRAA